VLWGVGRPLAPDCQTSASAMREEPSIRASRHKALFLELQTSMRSTGINKAEQESTSYEEVWLLGQPPLHTYLDFVKDMVIGGETLDPKALTDEWRVANDYYHELEEREAGIADEAYLRGNRRAGNRIYRHAGKGRASSAESSG